jgi:hypothetical protein
LDRRNAWQHPCGLPLGLHLPGRPGQFRERQGDRALLSNRGRVGQLSRPASASGRASAAPSAQAKE